MRRISSIGAFLRSAVPALPVHWSANVFVGACLVAIGTFTAAQVPEQTSPSPHQTKAKAKEVESGSCGAKSDALGSRIRGSAPRDASGYPERVSEETGEKALATNLTLQAPSPADSARNEAQGDEPATDVHQESREEPARPQARSPQQCTLSKGSRETERVPPR